MKSNAFAILAEKHLRMVDERFQQLSIKRDDMAVILRDCRTQNITVDAKYFDRLLDVCVYLQAWPNEDFLLIPDTFTPGITISTFL